MVCGLLGPPSSTRRTGATENFSRHVIFSQDTVKLLCEDYDMQGSSTEVQGICFVGYTQGVRAADLPCGTYKTYALYLRTSN